MHDYRPPSNRSRPLQDARLAANRPAESRTTNQLNAGATELLARLGLSRFSAQRRPPSSVCGGTTRAFWRCPWSRVFQTCCESKRISRDRTKVGRAFAIFRDSSFPPQGQRLRRPYDVSSTIIVERAGTSKQAGVVHASDALPTIRYRPSPPYARSTDREATILCPTRAIRRYSAASPYII